MTAISKTAILDRLSAVRAPGAAADIVAQGLVSEIIITGNDVMFALSAQARDAHASLLRHVDVLIASEDAAREVFSLDATGGGATAVARGIDRDLDRLLAELLRHLRASRGEQLGGARAGRIRAAAGEHCLMQPVEDVGLRHRRPILSRQSLGRKAESVR